jgi:amino acid transporter
VLEANQTGLVRAIGRWSLAALLVNTIIVGGVFGLPSVAASLVGRASPIAVLLAGAAVGVIMACFAEVASRFSGTGGPYLYARTAFGPFVGILTAWMLLLVRLTSAGAVTNIFVSYLAEFWPHARELAPRVSIVTLLVLGLVTVNYRGVRTGVRVSNLFTVAKLLPLAVFTGVGIFHLLSAGTSSSPASSPAPVRAWIEAVLLLIFAYGGFESALLPMGESKNPRRDAPFALLIALVVCTAVYTLVQVVVIGVLPDPATTDRPLASAAHYFLGSAGVGLITVGAMVSAYGWLTSFMLATPRLTFALAEHGDLPPFLAALDRRFRTPHVSIVIFGVLWWVFALLGSFRWNVALSVVARLIYYATVCAALPVLRRIKTSEALLTVPAGELLAILGVGISLVLIVRLDLTGLLILAVVAAIALANWLWAIQYGERLKTAPS